MTKDEAIEWLKEIRRFYIVGGDDEYDEKRRAALDMAIKALEERPTGEWMLQNKRFKNLQYHTCSNCGARARTILTGTRLVDNYYCHKCEPITEYEFDEELSDFCYNCGARMEVMDGR